MMEIDVAKMTGRNEPIWIVFFMGKGYLIIDESGGSFTSDQHKATRFMDRYDLIEATFGYGIQGSYMVTDIGE